MSGTSLNPFAWLSCDETEIKLCPDKRHEILNELGREMYYEDIFEWINGVMQKQFIQKISQTKV